MQIFPDMLPSAGRLQGRIARSQGANKPVTSHNGSHPAILQFDLQLPVAGVSYFTEYIITFLPLGAGHGLQCPRIGV